jgi:DNA invertase Pin-like site-specific DNA recombinase
MNTVVYRRVSGKGQDTASQDAELKRWVDAQGDPVQWVSDKFTGKTMDRPGWNKVAEMIKLRQVGRIVIWRLDRLGRTAKGLTALFEELREAGINLVSLRDGLDLTTPAGRLMANVLASVAAYETEIRGERVSAGLEVAKLKGTKLGRPQDVHTRLKVNPDQEAVIRRLKGEGQGVSAIARVTGLSRPTVYSVLAH